jgi:glycosyltransferase involved in cell wall biosynthesis
MRVLLTSEARFERTPDGAIWASASCGRAAWTRYLDVFSSVLIAARVFDVPEPSAGCVQASGPGIAFCALPPYSGLGGLVRSGRSVRAAINDAVRGSEAVIVRSPSPVAYLAARSVAAMGRPYGAQVVGDPDQVFSAGAFRHPLRVPLRHGATVAQKLVARHAMAVMFVTMETLQRKYPTAGRVYSGSDASLDDGAFAPAPLVARSGPEPFTFVTVGSLDQPYKGTGDLLDAFREIRDIQPAARLLIVGGGALMPAFQARAEALGLGANVRFLGQLDRQGVRRALDAAHVFVLPSLTEGLPRALLEAMARRLPCVATNVGGIPELLPDGCLVPPRNARALARKLRELMADDDARQSLAARNQRVASAYHERVQIPVQRAFLADVRDASIVSCREAACA